MRAVIVHESFFGNTKRLAEAMAARLGQQGHSVTVSAAADVAPADIESVDLLVVGAATHVHGMPRPSSRRGAVEQGAAAEFASARGVRELLDELTAGHGTAAAAFDTRARMPRWFSGAASRPIAARLRHHGYRVVARGESFLVDGSRGPLHAGEVARAEAWISDVARAAAAHAHATAA